MWRSLALLMVLAACQKPEPTIAGMPLSDLKQGCIEGRRGWNGQLPEDAEESCDAMIEGMAEGYLQSGAK